MKSVLRLPGGQGTFFNHSLNCGTYVCTYLKELWVDGQSSIEVLHSFAVPSLEPCHTSLIVSLREEGGGGGAGKRES